MRSNTHSNRHNSHSTDADATTLRAVAPADASVNWLLVATPSDVRAQCLRVLRCSARALATSPGGLRFKAGTRAWLEGLEPGFHGSAGRSAC